MPQNLPLDGDDDLPEDAEVFDIDKYQTKRDPKKGTVEPLYRVYKGSRIPISKAVGTLWHKRYDAAKAAYEIVHGAWDESFKYYNNHQKDTVDTPRGTFRRGDSTENVVYSNVNVMLPAVYGKDPDIAVNTVDEADDEFVKTLKLLLNTIMKSKHLLNAKAKIKRATAFALLTNFGVLKLSWTKKDDSREFAIQEMEKLTADLVKCDNSAEAEAIYGKVMALESRLEVFKKSGPGLKTILPHNLIIDPESEDTDGMDSNWMIEQVFYMTDALVAEFTEPCEGEDDENNVTHNLVYKPTHQASFANKEGSRDDGLGVVMKAINAGEVSGNEPDARAAYRETFYTECLLVWDKTLRRVMLYHKDDWSWPLWVWDDPLNITRFFPYFIIGFGMSTGGTVSVGETAYYLDQQDDINDINRQVGRIRRTIFDYFYYNSDAIDQQQAEKFVDAIRGKGKLDKNVLGVRAGEKSIKDIIEAFVPPSFSKEFAPLFDKEPILNTINRISNTSDALRGVQYKTNTNESAVQSYQDAARMSVGAKVDCVEDAISDMAQALAELCVQNYSQEEVATLIGQKNAANWENMDLETFNATYTFECVAGTTEKPNSIFKKKEAVQIAQTMGQFASAAPVTSLTLMLRVMENAFSEVVVHPEDWEMLKAEATAQLTKGQSVPGAGAPAAAGGADPAADMEQKMLALPPEVKQKVVQMKQQGMPDDQIAQFLMQQVNGGGSGAPSPAPTPAPKPAAQPA
jgi:hypothetical protein